MLLSSSDSNFTDYSVQLPVPDDELNFQDALTMEAIKLITKCQETELQDTTLDTMPSSPCSSLLNVVNTHVDSNGQENGALEADQLQRDVNCSNCPSKSPEPAINDTGATITSREDRKSVIHIPLVVKREDLTHGTSVELPIKIGNDENPKFVVQINLPRCLDCKNEPSCKCCKTEECSSGLNVEKQNNENSNTGNAVSETETTTILSDEIVDWPIILGPTAKETNSLM